MKIIQYLATSVNGHTTIGDDGTDWVTPQTITDFEKLNEECRVVIMGKKTYESFGNDFPQKNCLNIVMTTDPKLLATNIKDALFTDKTPIEIIQLAESRGFDKMFLVGGSQVNTLFLSENLIDEIWINIHPIIIGHGKYLYNELNGLNQVELELYESKPFDSGQMLLKYRFRKRLIK